MGRGLGGAGSNGGGDGGEGGKGLGGPGGRRGLGGLGGGEGGAGGAHLKSETSSTKSELDCLLAMMPMTVWGRVGLKVTAQSTYWPCSVGGWGKWAQWGAQTQSDAHSTVYIYI